jgi:hypothetical protein
LGRFSLSNLVDLSGQTFKEGPLVLTATIIAIANLILGFGGLYGWLPIWLYLTVLSLFNLAIAFVALVNADTSHLLAVLIPLVWVAIAEDKGMVRTLSILKPTEILRVVRILFRGKKGPCLSRL